MGFNAYFVEDEKRVAEWNLSTLASAETEKKFNWHPRQFIGEEGKSIAGKIKIFIASNKMALMRDARYDLLRIGYVSSKMYPTKERYIEENSFIGVYSRLMRMCEKHPNAVFVCPDE